MIIFNFQKGMEKKSRASQQAKIRKICRTEEQKGSVEWLHWPGWPMEAKIWQPHLRGRGIEPLRRHGGPLQAVARLRPQVKNFVDPAMFSFVLFSDESKIVTVWFPLWRVPVLNRSWCISTTPNTTKIFLIILKLIQQSIMAILSRLAKKNQNLNLRKQSSVYYWKLCFQGRNVCKLPF